MTSGFVLGVLFGTGVLVMCSGLIPARVPLADALARLHLPRSAAVLTDDAGSWWERVAGARLARSPVGQRISVRLAADLRITATALESLTSRMALVAVVGLIWVPAVVAMMSLGGVHVSLIVPAWASLAMALSGSLVPIVALRSEATQRRTGFRHALSAFLDLVAVRLAGGAGVDGALSSSAAAGSGWAFTEIRQALAEARFLGEPPWAGLARLGRDLEISELQELAASHALAGNEGAKVRASISTKASSIRTRGLADAESDAQSASERMSLPVVLLMVGFVAFLGYPAVMQVLTGL